MENPFSPCTIINAAVKVELASVNLSKWLQDSSCIIRLRNRSFCLLCNSGSNLHWPCPLSYNILTISPTKRRSRCDIYLSLKNYYYIYSLSFGGFLKSVRCFLLSWWVEFQCKMGDLSTSIDSQFFQFKTF